MKVTLLVFFRTELTSPSTRLSAKTDQSSFPRSNCCITPAPNGWAIFNSSSRRYWMDYREAGDAMGWSPATVARMARKYVHREKVAMATIARLNAIKKH